VAHIAYRVNCSLSNRKQVNVIWTRAFGTDLHFGISAPQFLPKSEAALAACAPILLDGFGSGRNCSGGRHITAGVLLALDGLHPSPEGARIRFSGGKGTATYGPFAEAKELLGGYWMIQVQSKAVAVEWALRCPAQDGDVIEVRQVQEMSEFPPEVLKSANL
jgi:hypothetical protein